VEGQPVRPASCRVQRFVADESGAAMTEYGFLLLFCVIVVMAAAKLLGLNVLPLFQIGQYL
jgi:Flp pilus assembly pilin Flp